MLKVRLKLMALKSIDSFEMYEEIEIENDVFDKKTGIAYFPLNKNWRIMEMEILEYGKIKSM